MQLRIRSLLITAAAVLWLAACGSNTTPTDSGSGGGDGGGGMDSGLNLPDGSVILGDGAIQLPDGNVVSPDAFAPNDSGGGGMDGSMDGSITPPDGAPPPDASIGDGAVIVGNQVYCGGHVCQCADGLDNDGDGLADNLDPECVSPFDDDESSFATGIPGDNMGSNAMTECFFDGNSGPGNDYMCVVPNGCDCRGCCAFDIDRNGTHEKVNIRDTNCHTVTLTTTPNVEGGPCTPDGSGGQGSCADAGEHCLLDGDGVTTFCAPCSTCLYASEEQPPIQGCETNPCDAGEVCIGDPPPTPVDGGTPVDSGSTPSDASTPVDAQPSDAQPVDAGTPPPQCGPGIVPCVTNADCSSVGSSYFCVTGCCYNLG